MRKRLLVLGLAFPLASQASPGFNIQEIICSGEFTSSGEALLCGGDLSLSGGGIYSDFSISIEAGGSLSLDHLDVQVLSLSLIGRSILIGDGVHINVQNISLAGLDGAHGGVNLPPGAIISTGEYVLDYPRPGASQWIGPGANIPVVWDGTVVLVPVPEPSIYSAMLVGVAALGWVSGRRRKV